MRELPVNACLQSCSKTSFRCVSAIRGKLWRSALRTCSLPCRRRTRAWAPWVPAPCTPWASHAPAGAGPLGGPQHARDPKGCYDLLSGRIFRRSGLSGHWRSGFRAREQSPKTPTSSPYINSIEDWKWSASATRVSTSHDELQDSILRLKNHCVKQCKCRTTRSETRVWGLGVTG